MDYEEFAETVRRRMLNIMGAAMSGNAEKCGELAAEVCTMAAIAKTQARVQAEAENPDRYDLKELPVYSPFDE